MSNIRHKENGWEVEDVGIIGNSDAWASFGYRWIKVCPVSGCVVFYNNESWEEFGLLVTEEELS